MSARRFETRNWRWAMLMGLVLLAAAVRFYWGTRTRVIWGDEPFYLWLGQSLLNGQGYQFFGFSATHFLPLFPLAAATIGRIAGNLAAGSVTLYVVCGAVLVLPIYGISKRLAGSGAAVAAGLVTAFCPALTAAALLWSTMTEPLFLLLIATAWWGLFVALQDNRFGGYALAGLMLGLAYLTRSEGLVYVIAGPVALFGIRLTLGRSAQLRRTLVGMGLMLLLICLVIGPFLVFQRIQTGRWQLGEQAGFAFSSMQGLAQRDPAMFDAATWSLDPASNEVNLFAPSSEGQGIVQAITSDPHGFARRLRGNITALLTTATSSRLLPWPMAALAFLGLFGKPWSARRLRGELLLIATLAGPLSFVLFDIQERYLSGLLIPALVWAGAGIAFLGHWLVDTTALCLAGDRAAQEPGSEGAQLPAAVSRVRYLVVVPALVLVGALLWQTPKVWDAMHVTHSFQPGHLAAAAALQTSGAPADAVVMSRYPAIAFHAGTRWTPTPAASWPEILAYAQAHSARYLVLDAWEADLRPQLGFLLDPAAAPSGMRRLATLEGGAGPVVIYELQQAVQ